jgi:AcrR family transcriptional regulator
MPRRRYDTEDDKRERILRAAWRRIRQYGYARTTVAEIAADAGIAKGTAYLYFRSKSDIMLALVEETNRRILEDLTAIQREDRPVVERLHDLMLDRVRAISQLVRSHPHGEEFVRSFKPEIVRRVHAFVARQGELAAALIREGNDSGALSVHDPDATGLLLAELFERFTPPYDHGATTDEVVGFAEHTFELLLHGMLGEDSPPIEANLNTDETGGRS